jgi:hypothetical protein
LRVNKEGQAGAFKTIKEALERAAPGDHIIVAGGEYEEQLILRNKIGIRIEAGKGEVVILPPANLSPRAPLLELAYTERIQIKRIKFRGQDRMHTLVAISGDSPGLRLEHLTLQDFIGNGVEITNCAGTRDGPVELQDLKTIPKDPKNPRPAITFRLNARVQPPLNDHIHIQGGQFEGEYNKKAKAIEFDKKFLGNDVTLNGKPLLD